ncbi:MAG: ABC transporter ATP-binding protein [Anaerolineae bacterium]|jgi:energy-coupling factor transport system ATP-binding protein|nr:ABC transporter ATP-binding protein [Anaerolineae bacterium]
MGQETSPKQSGTLQTQAVSYRYPQNGYGLAPLTLSIQPGACVLVTGPSGCGKSTLTRCLTGMIPHLYRGELEGEVWVEGLRTSETPLWQLAEHVGLVFQNPAAQMLSSSVEEEIIFGLENLGLPPEEIKKRTEAALSRFGLADLRHRTPQTLSGGEQQKLALAAIMAREPAILILDEPLSMLDGTAATDLVTAVADMTAQGTTAVICEHREAYLEALPGLQTLRLARPADQAASAPVNGSTSSPRLHLETPPFQLTVAGLSVQLGRRRVLHDVSFDAVGGEIIAVVGRNGVGKTTLLRALAGLQAYEGEIRVDGGRPDLGIVFQNADLQLFNPTVRDEVLYRLPDPDMTLYEQLLDCLALRRYEEVPPLLLSEGEKKRVALATVLMRRPQHGVLLDEPSLGQDAGHKTLLIRLIHALADAGRLVILTTHDLTLAAHASRLLLLGSAGIVADGRPAELLHDPRPWKQIGLTVPSWTLADLPGKAERPG